MPIGIEIVYAQPLCSIVKQLTLAEGSRVADALALVAADADFAGVDLASSPVGIFGKPVGKDQPLQHGDRIEIYRALAADPKIARRARAAAAKSRQ
jgi:putative ubiquitin-RnfH superfamily antitoxin RatB of RatAB toxin-antitoxin module